MLFVNTERNEGRMNEETIGSMAKKKKKRKGFNNIKEG
jgi:hypothetical protein